MRPIYFDEQWVAVADELGLGSKFLVANVSITALRGDGHKDTIR